MIKISFTPEFLQWVALQMRANNTGLDAKSFATEFFHRAFIGRGAEVDAAPLIVALEQIAGGDWLTARQMADVARAAIAAAKGEA